MSCYNNSCVANMTSDITFRMKSTSRKKNWNFIALAQLTKYSCNITKQFTKSMHLELTSFWWNWVHILNQQLHVRFTRYCLVIMQFFTAKYKKKGFKSSAWEDATFHSTFISHTQIGGKLENIPNKFLKKRTVRVLHQIDVPTSDHWRILQHTFRCFQTKTCHVAGRMKSFRKGHVTCRVLSIKWDCFLVCFVQNIRYLVGTSDVTTISNDWGNIFSILCKTSLKKKTSIAV